MTENNKQQANEIPDDLEIGLHLMLIRTGSTDLDDQGRIAGSLDLPLSDKGEAEARGLAVEIQNLQIKQIFAAPCISSQQTAQQICRDGNVKIKVDEALANLDHGLWHGKSIAELKDNQPKLYKQWQEQPETVCPPSGETVEEARGRVSKFLKKLIKKNKSGLLALVVSEPLACIIHSEVTHTDISELWQIEANCGQWNIVSVPQKAAV